MRTAVGLVSGAGGEKLEELASPQSAAILTAVTATFITAQLCPVAWAADVFLVIALGASAYMMGSEAKAVIGHLRQFSRLVKSRDGNLDEAARHLADAVAAVGIDMLLGLLLHKARAEVKRMPPMVGPPPEMALAGAGGGRMPAAATAAPLRGGLMGETEPSRPAMPPVLMSTAEGSVGSQSQSGLASSNHEAGGSSVDQTSPAGEAGRENSQQSGMGAPDSTGARSRMPHPDLEGFRAAVKAGDMGKAAEEFGTLQLDTQLRELNNLSLEQLGALHEAVRSFNGENAQVTRVTNPAHRADVGTDPATGTIRPTERDTALRLETIRGVRVRRHQESSRQKGDWSDQDGKTYDGCSPPASAYFDRQVETGGPYERSLRKHLETRPAIDYIVVDVSSLGLTPRQLQKLDAVISAVAGVSSQRIIRLP